MSAVKIYLVVLTKEGEILTTVHRDMDTLRIEWEKCKKLPCVGLIHLAFVRPNIKNISSLIKYQGRVLVSAAAKWALPDGYGCTTAVVAEMELGTKCVPLYQLTNGLGITVTDDELLAPISYQNSSSNTYTIAEAAREVLEGTNKPLNKEEIFAKIVERDLYHFGARKPLSVLGVELNRYTKDTDYSNAATEPLFLKLDDDRFTTVNARQCEPEGWLQLLAKEHPGLFQDVTQYGIDSEQTYQNHVRSLPRSLRDSVEVFRFDALKHSIDLSNPLEVISIAPSSITAANIKSLGLKVRVQNVFQAEGVRSLDDLRGLSLEDMLKWSNFGRTSAKDMSDILTSAISDMGRDVYEKPDSKLERAANFDSNLEGGDDEESYQFEKISSVPLREHFNRSLSTLDDKHRMILELRTGKNGSVMTLESTGEVVGVTRERVRQIQKKYVEKIIEKEFWDDCISLKIGQLLVDREEPLYIEMLEIEEPWFQGFMGNYQHLAAIIELFSENAVRVININGASVVTRITKDVWTKCAKSLRKSLQHKCSEGGWSRRDIKLTVRSVLADKGASELFPLMWLEFEQALQFDGEGDDSNLVSFGVTAESAVQAVLHQAEGPLHFTEIADRASSLLGRKVDERTAANATLSQGAKLFGRGIYGLEKFNPISDRVSANICRVCSELLYSGPLLKQWHTSEILSSLKQKFPALPDELNTYLLNIILEKSDRLIYLNRMVWARSDSNQSPEDRVDMADAFTQILEENGSPLKGSELKDRLVAIRGVPENLQLQPTERMIQIGPDLWGLIDRDIGGTTASNSEKLNELYGVLKERKKGIHVSEVNRFIDVCDTSKKVPSAYALFNLAQRDDRFYLGRSMYLGLAEWNGEVRRLNITQAVRKILAESGEPMTLAEINARVEDLTEMPVDGTVTHVLINEGAIYDKDRKEWRAS